MANNFNYGFNSYPTATQPYGYPMNSYNNYMQQQQFSNTNMIFVSGIEDVKLKPQLPNTTIMYVDNDKPLIYKKTTDNKGQYEIETFDIQRRQETPPKEDKSNNSVDLSLFAKKSDIDTLLTEIVGLKDQINKIKLTESINNVKTPLEITKTPSQNSSGQNL